MLESLRNALKGPSAVTAKVEPMVSLMEQSVVAVPDSRAQKITVAGFEVEGVSISGQETCIIVPRCKVIFDTGRCPQRAIFQQTVLLTHGHLDHIGGLPFHVTSRNMQGLTPSKLVVPPAYESGVRRLLDLHSELQGHRVQMEYELLPLSVGQEMLLPGGFIVRPFTTVHTVASQGYLLYSQRKKLRAALQGCSQEEIRDLRLSGQEVTETFEAPEIAFTGDTTAAFLEVLNQPQQASPAVEPSPEAEASEAEALAQGSLPVSTPAEDADVDAGGDEQPRGPSGGGSTPRPPPSTSSSSLLSDVLSAKLLIMELTFLDDSVTVEEAREKGHMHIADFVANAHRFQNEAILLVHFSPRYSRQHILDALNTWLPPALKSRCVPFLNGYT